MSTVTDFASDFEQASLFQTEYVLELATAAQYPANLDLAKVYLGHVHVMMQMGIDYRQVKCNSIVRFISAKYMHYSAWITFRLLI